MTVNILHLHSSFSLGGKEARAVRLMNAFGDRARHTIVSGVPGELGARDAIDRGIRYEIAQNPPPLVGRPSVSRYEAIAKFMAPFDLVLTYNWGAIDGVMAKRAFAKGMPPVIHHEDGFNEDEASGINPVRTMYRRVALGAARALVVPSYTLERIAQKAWKQRPDKIHRISNGIALDRYAADPVPDAIPGFRRHPEAMVIGTIAGLRPVKDLPLLVRAAAGMVNRVQLVIVGEGPEAARIRETAELMGLGDDLVMPGFLPDPHRYIGHFDLFALSSKSEQQPISVMEAMAAGLPVVSTPVGDITAMVSEANRPYISPNRNEVCLRDCLQIFHGRAGGRRTVGEANREKARAEFGEASMIAAYAKLYGEAICRPGAFL
ncbi:glycosyltransferase [Stakelama saccharophila]|uniref:Glycosyltransferase n=1 Tax=Stakelama saccharophila TaxID=3075605 RepID=A0ABZ0B6B3_9SPHN|nr:glycosyltransferase [Stakelama sp. W311]WNO52940.1 glycosyltransferase [Stakelama sp. W311]